ncbi:MAG: hypothetical protein V3V55_01190 [Rhodospirillales bacterium]
MRWFGFILVIFFFAISSFGPFSLAALERIGCDTLLHEASKSGEVPKVTLNTSWGIIRIETSLGYCREPVEVWRGRHLQDIPVTKTEESKTPKIQLPKQVSPKQVSPKPAVPEPAAPKPTAPVPTGKPCDKSLSEFWKQGEHSIKGTTYWLSQVFTIDRNGDGIMEDVGFRLKAKGKPDLLIRYFADGDQISARSLSRLALPDETVIPRLCFGQVVFEEPFKVQSVPVEKKKAFEIPDLAREMKVKTGEISEEPETAAKGDAEKTVGTKIWISIAAGLFVLFAAGGLIAFLTRRKWLPKLKKSAEDEEEDDDDDF